MEKKKSISQKFKANKTTRQSYLKKIWDTIPDVSVIEQRDPDSEKESPRPQPINRITRSRVSQFDPTKDTPPTPRENTELEVEASSEDLPVISVMPVMTLHQVDEGDSNATMSSASSIKFEEVKSPAKSPEIRQLPFSPTEAKRSKTTQ